MSTTPAGTRKRHPVAEIGMRLLDGAHAAWLAAELECEHALEVWSEGPRGDGYLSYLAALEREEAAAGDLQRLWKVAQEGHDALVMAAGG
jgi:hypothetical protein